MKPLTFTGGLFLGAFFKYEELPALQKCSPHPLVEIAIVGKSNVGKSSLINHLLKQKKLAKTSSTPGKTQTINLFLINDQILLTDLPGYGFAKVPKPMRAAWAKNIEGYLKNRASLLLLLIDGRRGMSEEDLQLIQFLSHHQKPYLLIYTKADLLSLEERKKLASPGETPLLYSIKGIEGRKALIEKINQFFKK